MKHTPAPWTISSTCREYNKELMILAMEAGDNGVHICQVTTNGTGRKRSFTDEQEANANLIAAAPELLAALKAMLNYANLGAYERADAVNAAHAAVRKAGGAA